MTLLGTIARTMTFGLVLVACSPDETSAQVGSREQQAGALDRRALLAELRSRLDELGRGPPPAEPVRRGGDLDVTPLVGMTQREIRSALGAPRVCGDLPGSPCRRPGDWYYDFMRLPAGYRGNGVHLRFQFDEAGACTSAEWAFSR